MIIITNTQNTKIEYKYTIMIYIYIYNIITHTKNVKRVCFYNLRSWPKGRGTAFWHSGESSPRLPHLGTEITITAVEIEVRPQNIGDHLSFFKSVLCSIFLSNLKSGGWPVIQKKLQWRTRISCILQRSNAQMLLSRAVHQESSCPAHAHRAQASCLPDSNPYGRDGLAHSRSLHRAARFACCLSRCRFFY